MATHTESTTLDASNRKRRTLEGKRARWTIVAAIAVGILIGRSVPDAPFAIAADPTTDATATRVAELEELNDLRTKVAQPGVCSPAPTATPTIVPSPSPTPTLVPVVPAGQEVRDANGWIITVLSIQPIPTPENVAVTGSLLRVNVTIENTSDDSQLPPLDMWRLVDQAGNRYGIDRDAMTAIASPAWMFNVGAHQAEDRVVVFDVSLNAGTTFVLEHETDPTFRIEVSIESRG